MSIATLRHGLLLLAALSGAVPARADTFIFKDQSKVEGTAVEEGDVLVITTYEGKVHRVNRAEVGWVKDPVRNEYHARAAKKRSDDAAGHYDLALWCKANALNEQAAEQFRLVLKADPFHEAAGKALGYERQPDGRWTPKDHAGLDAVTIGPASQAGAKPAPKNPREELDEARKVAKLILALSADWEKTKEGETLVVMAREKPEVFARVLKAPGTAPGPQVSEAPVRQRAAEVLGVSGDRRAMQPLLDACFEDPDDGVRLAAAKALPKLQEPIALRKLVDVAVSGKFNWPTRKLACIALRRYADKEAIERLLAELSFELAGGNPRDPKNAPRMPHGGLGTDNPLGLATDQPPAQTQDETILYPALSALKEVTGVSFDSGEKDVKTWKAWWKNAEAAFTFKN